MCGKSTNGHPKRHCRSFARVVRRSLSLYESLCRCLFFYLVLIPSPFPALTVLQSTLASSEASTSSPRTTSDRRPCVLRVYSVDFLWPSEVAEQFCKRHY